MTLEICGVTVRYGAADVVRDATIAAIAPGTITALVGPNAAGKSTLLRAAAGLVQKAAGKVTCGGCSLVGLTLRECSRHIRYVPQTYVTTARLPVIDAVLVARMAGESRRPNGGDVDAAAGALVQVGIDHLSDREAWTLSGGQQQLVALAMGLARPAPVLLLDEPTSALDLRHQLAALAVARDIAERGRRVVVIAMHDLNLAARHADRVVLLSDGRVVSDGKPLDVLSSPHCAAAYGVNISVGTTPRGSPVVEAFL